MTAITMRIKHYPGKAVLNDPSWLEMDIPNSTRGLQYEANWEDAQKNLSSGSSSNSWDKYSANDSELDRRSLLEDHGLYALPRKVKKTSSIRAKYHSDKCLSRINSRNATIIAEDGLGLIGDYYLPSQSRIRHSQSFRTTEEGESAENSSRERPKPKPRTKLPPSTTSSQLEQVMSDLEKQLKKSVRFNEQKGKDNKLIDEIEADCEDNAQERVSEWIDQQNEFFADPSESRISEQDQGVPNFEHSALEKPDEVSLNRNDSGYYEQPKKIRQRIPPKNIYPSSSEGSVDGSESRLSADSIDVYDIYKDDRSAGNNKRVGEQNGDFLIPRPKLIVPVHSYGIRKRRTGNLLQGRRSETEGLYDRVEDDLGELKQ